jgi:pimeloyl-ACP methyl ester carboxylesterase
MTPWPRKVLIGLGIAALIGLSVDITLRFVGPKRLRFTYLTGDLPEDKYAELAARPGWERASVEVAPGIALRGLVRAPRAAQAPWVLYYPGNDAAQLRSGRDFLLRLAGEQDWGMAVFAYRGYDGSSGVPHVEDLAKDAQGLLRGLCAQRGIDNRRLHVAGFSIGGHFAVHGALGAARAGRPVASLTLLNPVDDIVMLRRSRFQRLTPGDDFQTRPFLAGLPGPVLVVQGGADEALGGNTQGLAIATAMASRAQYYELPGVGHQQLLEEEAMFERVRLFIKAHL